MTMDENILKLIGIMEQSFTNWKLHIEENDQEDITDINSYEAIEWKKLKLEAEQIISEL